uniref:dihydrofolate reductase n=1 Tax=Fundulus heteroclitus TaxID=8078 RepID=A0A3Q2NMY1_FUNHE
MRYLQKHFVGVLQKILLKFKLLCLFYKFFDPVVNKTKLNFKLSKILYCCGDGMILNTTVYVLPPAGAHYLAADFCSALKIVDTELAEQADQVWVIGGSSLYKELMLSPGTRRLFVTRVQQQFDCDTFLPEIILDKYQLLSEFPGVPKELQEENGIQYKFEVYESI